jgi:hypothetical protein
MNPGTHYAADSSSAVPALGMPKPSSDLNWADTSSIAAFSCAIFSFKFFRVFCTEQKFQSMTRLSRFYPLEY